VGKEDAILKRERILENATPEGGTERVDEWDLGRCRKGGGGCRRITILGDLQSSRKKKDWGFGGRGETKGGLQKLGATEAAVRMGREKK